jgi:hypothetical protein
VTETSACGTCGGQIEYLDPTGDGVIGWWAHATHPEHEHDAVPVEEGSDSELDEDGFPSIRSMVDPPEGWFHVGTHANDITINVDFSDALDEDGLPLWERPTERGDR